MAVAELEVSVVLAVAVVGEELDVTEPAAADEVAVTVTTFGCAAVVLERAASWVELFRPDPTFVRTIAATAAVTRTARPSAMAARTLTFGLRRLGGSGSTIGGSGWSG